MFKEFLEQNNFSKRLINIKKRLKNKRVLIYGTGLLFKYINEHYDLSDLNIIGVTDRKYLDNERGNIDFGYNIVPYNDFMFCEFDYLFLTVKESENLKQYLSKIIPASKIIPLFQESQISKIIKKLKVKNHNNTFVLVKSNGKKIYNPKIKNLSLRFWGANNYVEIHEPYRIRDVKISCGNNNKIIINNNNRHTKASIVLEEHNVLCIGENTTMANVSLWFPGAKGTKILIGKDCMFSYGIEFRTGDGHSIYDINTKQLLNPGNDIIIGDHVWIGRNSLILKNSEIASNTIIGANSFINKAFNEQNCIIAGNPAKVVKKDVNWDRRATDYFDETLLR